MQLLITSYTPGSRLLHCIEADELPNVGDFIEHRNIHAKVRCASPISGIQGYDGIVVVDDLAIDEYGPRWDTKSIA